MACRPMSAARRPRVGPAGSPASRRRFILDLPIEAFSLRIRPRLQFTLERIPAELVLAQRLGALAGAGIEPHQQPVSFLARRVELQQSLRRLDRGFAGEGCS